MTTLDDSLQCLVRQQVCRADAVLRSLAPRAHALLVLGGAPAGFCPAGAAP